MLGPHIWPAASVSAAPARVVIRISFDTPAMVHSLEVMQSIQTGQPYMGRLPFPNRQDFRYFHPDCITQRLHQLTKPTDFVDPVEKMSLLSIGTELSKRFLHFQL